MIELVTTYKKDWTFFTLASLLNKSGYRLHLFIHKEDWVDKEVSWMINNFENIKIYESWWRSDHISRMTFHLKDHWKDKGGLAKRMVVWYGNRIFNRPIDEGDIPPASFFKSSLSFLSRDLVFDKSHLANYYGILNIATQSHQRIPLIDKSIVVLNYDRLCEFHDKDLFFMNQRMPVSNGNRPAVDTKLIACKDHAFFEALTFYNHSWSPLYVNGKVDTLVELDAVGAKELLDYNVMLRKSWSIDVEHRFLAKDYLLLQTGLQLAVPWDCYTRLIDSIPLNFRNARLNEVLLTKTTKQKATTGKLVERGFYLGKV